MRGVYGALLCWLYLVHKRSSWLIKFWLIWLNYTRILRFRSFNGALLAWYTVVALVHDVCLNYYYLLRGLLGKQNKGMLVPLLFSYFICSFLFFSFLSDILSSFKENGFRLTLPNVVLEHNSVDLCQLLEIGHNETTIRSMLILKDKPC